MQERTVRDVPRSAFIQHLAKYLHNQNKLECPVQSHCKETQQKTNNYKKWWFLEASKYIIQWYEAPSLPPPMIRKKPETKEEKNAIALNKGIWAFIKQFIELGWIGIDRTGIVVVTEFGKQQIDLVATNFKEAQKA